MEPTIYKPSIYKGAGIYKTGAEGGGGGLPDDVVLYQVLKNTARGYSIGWSIPFSETNENKEFIVSYKVDSWVTYPNSYLIGELGYNTLTFTQSSTSYFMNNNYGSNALYNGLTDTNFHLLAIKNNKLIDKLTNNTLISNIPYNAFNIGTLRLFNQQNSISIYEFAIKKDDSFIMRLRPAKKGANLCLFDIINNVEYYPISPSSWEVEIPII